MQPCAGSMGHTGGGTRLSADADQADVEKVLAGDVDAFENIVRRWQGPLVNLAYRFCRDRSRAEDMAQDDLPRVAGRLADGARTRLFPPGRLRATNLYRSELRRIPPRTLPLDEAAEAKDLREPIDSEDGSRDRAVRHAVLALPAKYIMRR